MVFESRGILFQVHELNHYTSLLHHSVMMKVTCNEKTNITEPVKQGNDSEVPLLEQTGNIPLGINLNKKSKVMTKHV